ncbi:pre-mRNA-splicing factor SLU7 [Pyrrhoderma noxium]|uniref:Pre-mRNA-splicing factor SLU7 n=1 Tax=Pyrrhoderma noxium TaxID=2282107 RepID=A0A286UG15_9AGAM|nr:pre-mRNA-splicing factor SLU7 [Pyrrhoderma noxium]
MASSSAAGKVSREEFRRQKDLDAARKAGTAPAELDAEGRPINPHIPQYISQAPWYLDTGAPSLSHQRIQEKEKPKIDNWYDRGKKAGPAATKYRKGACENCGAATHKREDCLERPRKKGAKYTGKDIQADELIQEVPTGYDAKRDRWNGYDVEQYSKIYDEYAAVEAARQKLREQEIDAQTTTDLAAVRKVAKAGKGEGGDPDFGSSDEEDDDEEKYADAADAVGQKLDTKTRITVRNLRIREDTAKYLINLDPSSAYYDPKTRSMRDAPNKNLPAEDSKFAGDNFYRYSGEAPAVQKLQLFAWQSAARGNDVHLNANPTQGEILHKQFQEKKEELRDTQKVGILAKYGGEQYLEKAPKELLQGQTEEYVEYSRTGQVIKGQEKAKARSKYMEDVYINNHTSIWGSWYDVSSGQWGYACCHSIMHLSYCAGKAAIDAAEASSARTLLLGSSQATSSTSQPSKTLSEQRKERLLDESEEEKGGKNGDKNYIAVNKRTLGEGKIELDQERLAEAIREERKRKARNEDDNDDSQARRKKYNSSLQGGKAGDNAEVTEEELEAYRRNRMAGAEDPMYNYEDNARGDYDYV